MMLCSVRRQAVGDIYEDRTAFGKKLFVSLHGVPILKFYLLTPISTVFLKKPTGSHLPKKHHAFYVKRMFHTRVHNSPTPVSILSHINPVRAPTPTSRSTLMLSCTKSPFPFSSLRSYQNISPGPKAYQSIS